MTASSAPPGDQPSDIQPDALADALAPILSTSLVAFDVDGVLAPLVDHADQAALPPGVHDSLTALARQAEVAVISGRSLESLERLFSFDAAVHVIGSHGVELRGADAVAMSDDEQYRFDQISLLGAKAVEAIGSGAWLETKLTSVVVHTRTADPAQVDAPLGMMTRLAGMVDGVTIKPGSNVVELMARTADKGSALAGLAHRLGLPAGGFFGDDVTDEDAFAALGPDAITVKVGSGPSRARYRLADPAAVAETLRLLST